MKWGTHGQNEVGDTDKMKWGTQTKHTHIKVIKYVNLFHTRKQKHAKKPISRNNGHAQLYADISRPSAGPIV
jgi:hypothetical protein